MPVSLGYAAIKDALRMPDAIRLVEEMLNHEADGRTFASPKFNVHFEGGVMRFRFAADYEAGYFATKAYHTVKGAGGRHLVTLYRARDGELLALIDGSVITDLRTGAASGVVARRVPVKEPITVGILGSGHQAHTQLESLAGVYRITSASVYSPTAAHRDAFAAHMSARLNLPIRAAESAESAVRNQPVVVTASNSRSSEPVARAAWLGRCRLLCAVGNTRAQCSELEVKTFSDAALVVADSEHAFGEAGEFRRAEEAGALPLAKRATLAQLVAGAAKVPRDGLVIFKSVGSALQDLALAGRCYELLGERAGVPTAADLAKVRQPLAERKAVTARRPASRLRS